MHPGTAGSPQVSGSARAWDYYSPQRRALIRRGAVFFNLTKKVRDNFNTITYLCCKSTKGGPYAVEHKTLIKTDGSARNNSLGIGVHVIYIEDGKIFRRASYSHTIPTNHLSGNRAELEAILNALLNVPHLGTTEIHSDSSYAVNVINYGKKIKKNVELITEIRQALKLTGAKLSWIPRQKNKIADKLSRKGSAANSTSSN